MRCNTPYESLVDYQDCKLEQVAADEIRTHLGSCADCARMVADLGRLVPDLRGALAMPGPSQRAIEYARMLPRRLMEESRPSIGVRIASLMRDSRTRLGAAGARGEAPRAVQLLYEADSYLLHVWQERSSGQNWSIIGEALVREGGEPALVDSVLLTGSDGISQAALFTDDQFRLQGVANGAYRLQVSLPDADITVPYLLIGASD